MKQTCTSCGQQRKGKHFTSGLPVCDDCLNPAPNMLGGLPPQLQALFGSNGQLLPGGGQVGGPEPKPKKEPTGPVYKSVSEVATFDFSGDVKKIELQLEFGMDEQGKPLTKQQRADLQKQYARMTFQSDAEVDEDEEADVLKSILGGADDQVQRR